MTTATSPDTTDTIAAIAAVREQLDAARKERARLGEESRTYQREIGAAEAGLDHLARTAPDQFTEGQPKPKTEAAKLRAKLDEAQTNRWPAILAGADERIAALEREVSGLVRDNVVGLARVEYDRGLAGIQQVQALAPEMLDVIGRARATEPALLAIATAAGGGNIDGRSVQVDPLLGELERVLRKVGELEPARIPVLTPYVDEEPTVVQTAAGGWIHVSNAGRTELAEQPPKIERPS